MIVKAQFYEKIYLRIFRLIKHKIDWLLKLKNMLHNIRNQFFEPTNVY